LALRRAANSSTEPRARKGCSRPRGHGGGRGAAGSLAWRSATRVVRLDRGGETKVAGGVLVAEPESRRRGQGRERAQTGPHLRRRAFEQAAATGREEGVAVKTSAGVPRSRPARPRRSPPRVTGMCIPIRGATGHAHARRTKLPVGGIEEDGLARNSPAVLCVAGHPGPAVGQKGDAADVILMVVGGQDPRSRNRRSFKRRSTTPIHLRRGMTSTSGAVLGGRPCDRRLERAPVRLRGILAHPHHQDHVGGIALLADGGAWVAGHAEDRGEFRARPSSSSPRRAISSRRGCERGRSPLMGMQSPVHTRAAIAWGVPAESGGTPADVSRPRRPPRAGRLRPLFEARLRDGPVCARSRPCPDDATLVRPRVHRRNLSFRRHGRAGQPWGRGPNARQLPPAPRPPPWPRGREQTLFVRASSGSRSSVARPPRPSDAF